MIDEKVIEILKTCPYLAQKRIGLNLLNWERGNCSIEAKQGPRLLKRYSDGGQLLKREYVFAYRAVYSEAVSSRKDAAELLENVALWLDEERQNCGVELGAGYKFISLEGDGGYSVSGIGTDDARYEMKLRLVYLSQK